MVEGEERSRGNPERLVAAYQEVAEVVDHRGKQLGRQPPCRAEAAEALVGILLERAQIQREHRQSLAEAVVALASHCSSVLAQRPIARRGFHASLRL